MTFDKKRNILKAFVESQFKYRPLVWMFYNRSTNNKINMLHERALRIVYNDYHSSFEQLLINDGSFCIHHQNIQSLMIEIFKILNGMTSNVCNEIFFSRDHEINLRSHQDLKVPSINSVLQGKNSLRYFGPVIWNSIPIDIRKSENLYIFKSKIKTWNPESCTCRLCKEYLDGVGYI